MFFFITSLKHPLVTKSPALVYKLLDRTLSTINAQTNKNFRVIIVCHEIPKLSVQYDFIDYVIVDFPPPAKNFSDLVCGKSCDADFRENRHKIARIDKGRKYLH